MNKNGILGTIAIFLLLLGLALIYLGALYAPNVMLPPIISGIGFILMAWALQILKDRV